MIKKAYLTQIEYPDYGVADKPGTVSIEELEGRLSSCRKRMAARSYTHLLVYGDREHFANLTYLTHFDPRFEEALLVLSLDSSVLPLLLVGNEGEGHLGVSPLFRAGKLRHVRYQTFSLMNQPRERNSKLDEILRQEGIDSQSRVGVIGWKYYTADGFANPKSVLDILTYITDILRSALGVSCLENATDMMISPAYGMRSFLSAYEAAYMEYSNVMGSEAMKVLLQHFEADKTDFQLMEKVPFTGFPFSCHPSIKSSGNLHYGLSSPTGDIVRRGSPCSISIAYWGSNICRAGWVATSADDLPMEARDYIESFVAPYAEGVAAWLEHLQIGTTGDALYQLIATHCPFEKFGIYLNPGHLIHLDEWLSSPIYEKSDIPIRSGMCLQIDIIPRSSIYSSSRMEDAVLIADEHLQQQLKESYPAMYERCMKRRKFMFSLGFSLPYEVLPLSNMAGMIVPFFLSPQQVIAFESC